MSMQTLSTGNSPDLRKPQSEPGPRLLISASRCTGSLLALRRCGSLLELSVTSAHPFRAESGERTGLCRNHNIADNSACSVDPNIVTSLRPF